MKKNISKSKKKEVVERVIPQPVEPEPVAPQITDSQARLDEARRLCDEASLSQPQRRRLKEKIKREETKQRADAAGLNLSPSDPLQAARMNVYRGIADELAALKQLTDASKTQNVNETLTEIDKQKSILLSMLQRSDECVEDQTKKAQKPERNLGNSDRILKDIQNLLKQDDFDQTYVDNLCHNLSVVTQWDNFKKSKVHFQKLTEDITKRIKENDKLAEMCKASVRRDRIVDRVRNAKSISTEAIDNSTIISHGLDFGDMKAEFYEIISAPDYQNRFLRSLERKFEVVVDRRKLGAKEIGWTINGLKDDVEAALKFIDKIHYPMPAKTLQNREIAAIIGGGGSVINKLQESTNCVIIVSSNDELLIFGSDKNRKAAIKEVQNLLKEPLQLHVPCAPHFANAVNNLFLKELRQIMTTYDVKIKYTDTNEGSFVVRGDQEKVEPAKTDLKQLFDTLVDEVVQAEPEYVERFFQCESNDDKQSPKRGGAGNVKFYNRRLIVNDNYNVNVEKCDTGIILCGRLADVAGVAEVVADCIDKMINPPLFVELSRSQEMSFKNPNRLKDIETATGASAKFYPNSGIEIRGTAEQQREAQMAVEQIIEEESFSDSIPIDNRDVSARFLKDRKKLLRDLQDTFGCNVESYNTSDGICISLKGSKAVVEECSAKIRETIEEIKLFEDSMVTKTINFDASKAGIIVGKKGATIINIQETSGVVSADMRSGENMNTESGAKGASSQQQIILKGTAAAVDRAEAMIQNLLETKTTVTNHKGSPNHSRNSQSHKKIDTSPVKAPSMENVQHFPTLGESKNLIQKQRMKNRNTSTNSDSEKDEPCAEKAVLQGVWG